MSDWEKEMSIGVKELDEQHKSLFEMLKKLNCTIGEGEVDSAAREAIAFLEDYIVNHFDDEETFLRSINYDKLEEHSNEHSSFVLEFARKKNKLLEMKTVKESFVLELQNWIGKWFSGHIVVEDKKIQKFIEKNNIKI